MDDILYRPEYAEVVNRYDDVLMEVESAVAVGNATGVSPRRLAEARRLCTRWHRRMSSWLLG